MAAKEEDVCCPGCGDWRITQEMIEGRSPLPWCMCPTTLPGEYPSPLGDPRDDDDDYVECYPELREERRERDW